MKQFRARAYVTGTYELDIQAHTLDEAKAIAIDTETKDWECLDEDCFELSDVDEV